LPMTVDWDFRDQTQRSMRQSGRCSGAHAFAVLHSMRLDLGAGSQVHP
jgi:hypothetical protein